MYQQHFPTTPMTSIRILNNAETKDSIDAWFVQVKAFLRAIPVYAKYMDLVWTSHSASEPRGFQNVVDDNNTVTATAETALLICFVLTHLNLIMLILDLKLFLFYGSTTTSGSITAANVRAGK